MSSRDGREDVEDEAAAGLEQPADRAERRAPVVVGLHVQQRAERDDDERHALVHRRLAQVAEAEVELDAGERGALARRPRASRGDESTPMTRIPSHAIGTAIRPVPTPSSTTGPPVRRASSR